MKNRGGKLGILTCAGEVVLLWLGCCPGAVAEKPREAHQTVAVAATRSCAADRECPLGFCDRGVCVEVAGKSNYGGVCDSRPPAWSGQPGQPDAQCGGYLCAHRRCRSCRSDAECQHYFGAGKCRGGGGGIGGMPPGGYMPGFRCELPTDQARYAEAADFERTGSLPCANVGRDVPVEQRLAAGKACIRDCDCRSGFCDRGICAVGTDTRSNYGKGWCNPQSPIAPVDFAKMEVSSHGPTGVQCGSYLCIDQRCRSCVSDAECQEGSKEYRCLTRNGRPGKRCGWPSEATSAPQRNGIGGPLDVRQPPDGHAQE